MTDLIRRSAVIDAIRGEREYLIAHKQLGAEHVLAKHADAVIDSIPAIDAVPVVRCRECRYAHLTYDGEEAKYCDAWAELYEVNERVYLSGDFYCAHGQRREDGDT